MNCSPPGPSVHGDSPGKNTGVGCHALLQGIFLYLGIQPRSPALQVDSLLSQPPGKSTNTGVDSLSLLQRIFLTQGLREIRRVKEKAGQSGKMICHWLKERKLNLLHIFHMPGPSYLVFSQTLPHGGFGRTLSRGNCHPIFQMIESRLYLSQQLTYVVSLFCDAEKSESGLHVPWCLWGRAELWGSRGRFGEKDSGKAGESQALLPSPMHSSRWLHQNRGPSPLLGYLSGKKSDMRRHFLAKGLKSISQMSLLEGMARLHPESVFQRAHDTLLPDHQDKPWE